MRRTQNKRVEMTGTKGYIENQRVRDEKHREADVEAEGMFGGKEDKMFLKKNSRNTDVRETFEETEGGIKHGSKSKV